MSAVRDPEEVVASFSVGAPAGARRKSGKVGGEGVVTVTIRGPEARALAFAQAIERLAPLASELFDEISVARGKQLLEAVSPEIPPPVHIVREAAMLAKARREVLDASEWVTAARIAEIAGLSGSNPSAQPNTWKQDRKIFAIENNGKDYFPDYGLDPDKRYRPRPVMADVLRVFGDTKSPWKLAFWFASVNSYLGGKRPLDLLATRPQDVIRAAQAEVEGVLHG